MKKIKLFCCVLLMLTAPALMAQQYKVKTIFQLLGIENTKRPLNAPASPPDERRMIVEEMLKDMGIDEGPELAANGILKTSAPLADWLAKHPAGNRTMAPVNVHSLGYYYPYRSVLQYSSAGYVLTDHEGKTIRQLGSFFYTSQADHNGYGFNAYDENKNSMYYDEDGKLVFDHRFQFVEELGDKYYKFYEGKKAGIADSTGKILLPAKYEDVIAFSFKGKPWFSIKEGDEAWFIEYGKPEKILKNRTGNQHILPDIISDRYWLLDGDLFDMQTKEKLFAGIKYEIKSHSDNKAVFYIIRDLEREDNEEEDENDRYQEKRDEEEEIYFDVNGNLLFGQPVRSAERVSDSTFVIRLFDKDTLVKGKKYPLDKFGLADESGKWIKKPVYQYMREITEGNAIVFITRFSDKSKAGLMGASGKILIPEGKYFGFDEAGKKGEFVCYDTARSDIWYAATNTFKRLPKNFFDIRHYGQFEKMGLMKGVVPRDKVYLLDTNYQLVDTTAWADIDVNDYSSLVACYPYENGKKDYYGEKLFFTTSHQQVTITYQGKTYSTFTDIDSLAPGIFFYRFKNGNNLLRTKDGNFFATTCSYLKYDPFYDWYIGRGKSAWGILDNAGRELLPFSFEDIKPYSPLYRTAALKYSEDKLQQLDAGGHLLFNGEYDRVDPVTADYFIAERKGVKGLLHRSGKVIMPVSHQYLEVKNGLIWYGMSEYNASYMPMSELVNK